MNMKCIRCGKQVWEVHTCSPQYKKEWIEKEFWDTTHLSRVFRWTQDLENKYINKWKV